MGVWNDDEDGPDRQWLMPLFEVAVKQLEFCDTDGWESGMLSNCVFE